MTFALAKPKRERSKSHLDFIRQLPCVMCAVEGRATPPRSVDAAHVSFLGDKGFGSKVSDHFAAPLCRDHHSDQHANPPEKTWWVRSGVRIRELCAALFAVSGDVAEGARLIADYASRARRLPTIVRAAQLGPYTDTTPRRVMISAHLATGRDANGNQAVLLPVVGARGAPPVLVHVDPEAITPDRSTSSALSSTPEGETGRG